MPQIIVTADRATDPEGAPVMFRERVNVKDFESEHFAAQLVERLNWAVGDAHEVEQSGTLQPERSPQQVERPEAHEDEEAPDPAPAGLTATASLARLGS